MNWLDATLEEAAARTRRVCVPACVAVAQLRAMDQYLRSSGMLGAADELRLTADALAKAIAEANQ